MKKLSILFVELKHFLQFFFSSSNFCRIISLTNQGKDNMKSRCTLRKNIDSLNYRKLIIKTFKIDSIAVNV